MQLHHYNYRYPSKKAPPVVCASSAMSDVEDDIDDAGFVAQDDCIDQTLELQAELGLLDNANETNTGAQTQSKSDESTIINIDDSSPLSPNGGGRKPLRYWDADPNDPDTQRRIDRACAAGKCFVCGAFDHKQHDCPLNSCYYCKQPGHKKQDCPELLKKTACFFCGEQGHMRWECPQWQKRRLVSPKFRN